MAEREQLSIGELTLTGARTPGVAINVLIRDVTGDALMVQSTTAATDTASGYAKGCLWIDTDAAAGAVLKVNKGTRTSAVWQALDSA